MWEDEFDANSTWKSDPVAFWARVHDIYPEIAEYALAVLTTPVSNAVAERIFSYVTNIKTKLRNRIQIRMLDALLRIRCSLIMTGGGCCRAFRGTQEMIDLFNNDMYDNNEDLDDDVDLILEI